MSVLSRQHVPVHCTDVVATDPPAWVLAMVSDGETASHEVGLENASVRSTCCAHFTLVSSHIRRARQLGREQLADAVCRCYCRMGEIIFASQAPNPVRFWNHLGHIHEPMGEGLDRYMAFNMGRFKAFDQWYDGSENFDRRVATASGVGYRGDDIVIHVLGADRGGIAVPNPRQVQPFHYSNRYGPRPPCFARATIVPMLDRDAMLLIGGTASILGEESMYVGDLDRQLDETFENIAALIDHASAVSRRRSSLRDICDLRVYIVDPATQDRIENSCRKAAPNATEIQFMHADLCRRELMVEIEGRAMLHNS